MPRKHHNKLDKITELLDTIILVSKHLDFEETKIKKIAGDSWLTFHLCSLKELIADANKENSTHN